MGSRPPVDCFPSPLCPFPDVVKRRPCCQLNVSLHTCVDRCMPCACSFRVLYVHSMPCIPISGGRHACDPGLSFTANFACAVIGVGVRALAEVYVDAGLIASRHVNTVMESLYRLNLYFCCSV